MVGVVPLLLLHFNLVLGSKLCPNHCLCYDSSYLVDCQSRGLTHVPHNIPHGSWLLDLSRNNLSEIRNSSFTGLWALRILLLYNNSIQALQPQSLSSLRFLERLDLSFNRLHWLPQDFSQSLSSLQELWLNHNQLQHVDSHWLKHLENLRKLDLSYNGISMIDVTSFNSLAHLRFLNLEGNQLDLLSDGLLTRQHSLEVLLLSHNNISMIEADALAALRSLTLLGLQRNQLEHLNFKTFLNLQTTRTFLQMSLNPWTCDCDLHRVFSKIQRVRHLHVEDYKDILCNAPVQLAGAFLSEMDNQLCMAEMSTVLCISITVICAVVAALVKAQRNKKLQEVEINENKPPEKRRSIW